MVGSSISESSKWAKRLFSKALQKATALMKRVVCRDLNNSLTLQIGLPISGVDYDKRRIRLILPTTVIIEAIECRHSA